MMENQPSILIIDSDLAFATMLQEGLQQGGEYRATVTTRGEEALHALAADAFDLAVVDLGLTDPDGITLARALRQRQADLRLVLIPLGGADIPAELADLPVQGVLPKPFFLPDLPGRIAEALAQPVDESPGRVEVVTTEPGTIPDRLAGLRERIPQISEEMATLSREIHATAVILTHGGKLIAHISRLSAEETAGLAQAVADSWRTSARVAQILGREQLRFEQSVEGGQHMFYSLAVAEDVIISAALSISVPLGIVRHRTKATAEVLRRLIGTAQ
jgi:two-component system KDP operon response regulator KdpE